MWENVKFTASVVSTAEQSLTMHKHQLSLSPHNEWMALMKKDVKKGVGGCKNHLPWLQTYGAFLLLSQFRELQLYSSAAKWAWREGAFGISIPAFFPLLVLDFRLAPLITSHWPMQRELFLSKWPSPGLRLHGFCTLMSTLANEGLYWYTNWEGRPKPLSKWMF